MPSNKTTCSIHPRLAWPSWSATMRWALSSRSRFCALRSARARAHHGGHQRVTRARAHTGATGGRGNVLGGMLGQTEMGLRNICEGTKTKADMVRRSIDQYREVFMRANAQVGRLAEVAAAPWGDGALLRLTVAPSGHLDGCGSSLLRPWSSTF